MLHGIAIILKITFGVFIIFLHSGYVIYYLSALQCGWPPISDSADSSFSINDDNTLRALIMADVNVFGPGEKSWFNKWRIEWQLHQAYKAIFTVHSPEVIFVLGNLLNEGAWDDDEQFEEDAERFFDLFPDYTNMFVVAGTQDIGFHDQLRPGAVKRFNSMMNITDVQYLFIKDSHFILLNSVALYGDSCDLCKSTRNKIDELSEKLKYFQRSTRCGTKKNCSNPIIMQNLPLYRKSDEVCLGPDVAPPPNIYYPFIPNFTSLSVEASKYLAIKLKPRATFAAHTFSCLTHHVFKEGNETVELSDISVPFFNWKYRREPKYLLVTITPNEVASRICDLPTEFSIVFVSFILLVITICLASYNDVKAYIFQKPTLVDRGV